MTRENLPRSIPCGLVLAAGPVEETLTDASLSSCFGIPISVTRGGDRWSATAATSPG